MIAVSRSSISANASSHEHGANEPSGWRSIGVRSRSGSSWSSLSDTPFGHRNPRLNTSSSSPRTFWMPPLTVTSSPHVASQNGHVRYALRVSPMGGSLRPLPDRCEQPALGDDLERERLVTDAVEAPRRGLAVGGLQGAGAPLGMLDPPADGELVGNVGLHCTTAGVADVARAARRLERLAEVA